MKKAENMKRRLLVSRWGKPKSVEDCLRNIIKQPQLLTKVQLSAEKAGLDKLTDQEIEKEIEAIRN